MKRSITQVAGIGSLGAAGLLGIVLAMPSSADEATPDGTTTTQTDPDDSSSTTQEEGTQEDGTEGTEGERRGFMGGPGGHGPGDHGFGGHGPGGHGFGGDGPGGHGPGGDLETLTEVLGLSQEELMTELEDGATLGEVADAQGVDRQVLVDALLAQHEERITEMLDETLPVRPGPPAGQGVPEEEVEQGSWTDTGSST